MNVENLVTMANQIGSFYETMPDRNQALKDISGHLKKYWEPRMRRALLEHIDVDEETQLSPIVMESIRTHRELF
ncbi:formate dehydrogenase subunit delta [Solimicrobium silvestre]|uniref:NADH-dependent formate dehydrogenase delta subunit FdsD n=1 Tax=Solimicrobium silvestre TaxID=2099400 RepID=A0A2S9GVG7_9BURK|nr:formate dehydrogenase subunit delta [Solimicrobium silvestre]PRC91656.1 NADH-dependent formate dehydrogenase delta subunit FdsD [Solimicrobium silvestre]